MPKARQTRRSERHDPLRRPAAGTAVVTREQVVPVLTKLSTGTDGAGSVSTSELVWALASVSSLFTAADSEEKRRDRRTLLSSNVVTRVVHALDAHTDLEVRREASGALRNLCVDGGAEVQGELANKGGVDALLRCLRWAALGLQRHARAPDGRTSAEEARAQLLSKPEDQMNRKERRHAAKLRAGKPLPSDADTMTELQMPPGHDLDPLHWGADAPATLAEMGDAAGPCLIEMCTNAVTALGCLCETSDKLLQRVVHWDWDADALTGTGGAGAAAGAGASRTAFPGEALSSWLCAAVALGADAAAASTPLAAPLVELGSAAANVLCALSDEDRHGVALALVGLPSLSARTARGKRVAAAAPAPTPAELRNARIRGAERLSLLARAAQLLPGDAPPSAWRPAALGVTAAGALCNVLGSLQDSSAARDAVEAHGSPEVAVGGEQVPLAAFVERDVLPRLVQVLQVDTDALARTASARSDTVGAARADDALQTLELALETLAECMSRLGKGDLAVERLQSVDMPMQDEEEAMWEEDMERLAGDEDDTAAPMEHEAAPPAAGGAAGRAADVFQTWVFAQLLNSALPGELLRLAAPVEGDEGDGGSAGARRALATRALAVLNNLLLRLAQFAPPPPSQWPEDPAMLERIAQWRAWLGTGYLGGGAAQAAPAGEALRQAWSHVFATAAFWAAVPSVVDATLEADQPASAAAMPVAQSAAHDGLIMVDTALGCLWSLARILEGQLPLTDAAGAPAPVVGALSGAYHSARQDSVRVKAIGTLALLARSQCYLADGAATGTNAAPPAYMDVYATVGDLFLHILEHVAATGGTSVEAAVAAANALIDVYANEAAPWDPVYRERGYQGRLAAVQPRIVAMAKRVDKGHAALRVAASEAASNLRAFLEYRASV